MASSCTWVKPKLSFGPLPRARYVSCLSVALTFKSHSAVSWTENDRYLFIWGGEVTDPDIMEKDSVYKLDTSKYKCATQCNCLRDDDLVGTNYHWNSAAYQ